MNIFNCTLRMNNAGFDFDMPFSRAARVFLLGVFAWSLCLGISAYFCVFLRIVAGYGFGLMFIFHQEPARNGMESGPKAHKLKALHCSQLIFVNCV